MLRALFLSAALLCGACSSSDPGPAESYTVRGKVEKTLGAGTDRPMVSIHHEAIPRFKNREGRTVGMESMAMSFSFDEAKLGKVLADGAPVEITFEVHWEQSPPLVLKDAKALPTATKLELSGHHDHSH